MQLLEVLRRRCSLPSELSLRLGENRTKWRGQRVVDKPDTDTQTDKQTDIPLIHKQTDIQTYRHTDRRMNRQITDTQTDKQTYRPLIHRQTTDIQTGKWKDHRDTDRQTDRKLCICTN